jgi:hypothetical protein
VEIGVSLCVRVPHRDLGAELDMAREQRPESGVACHADLIQCAEVQLDASSALRLGDVQSPVDLDQVLEAQLAAGPIRAARRLGRERREMVHTASVSPHRSDTSTSGAPARRGTGRDDDAVVTR